VKYSLVGATAIVGVAAFLTTFLFYFLKESFEGYGKEEKCKFMCENSIQF
jgi:hypothetical protein